VRYPSPIFAHAQQKLPSFAGTMTSERMVSDSKTTKPNESPFEYPRSNLGVVVDYLVLGNSR